MWKKQLIALNLALLLLGLTTAPVLAAERLENKIISQNSFNVPYVIMVDGTIFHSDRDTSGEHWSYTAENHQLTLTNYSGGSISASGDLTIFSEGNVNIVGSDGNDYGNDGIQVTGTLNFYIWNTFLSVSGGDGALGGGSAIHADKLLLFSFSDNNFYFYGGNTDESSVTDLNHTSSALYAGDMFISGNGDFHIYGGNVPQEVGGSGIIADTVYINANCTIQGGSGNLGGVGLWYISYCKFGTINASISCGAPSGFSIYCPNFKDYCHSEHTTILSNITNTTITVNQYVLTLYGGSQNATLPDGTSWTSLTAYYPTGYDLTDYIFQRPGYVQLAWTGTDYSSSDPLPLNAYFTPATNCSLYTYWTKADPGDIILNALSGRLTGGSFYQKTSGTPVTLPNQVTYEDESSLLGWSTSLETDTDSAQFFPGQWYEGGDVVSPAENAATVLYAREPGTGQYILYYPTQGTVTAGGTVLVQGSVASYPDLLVYAPDGSRFTPPENYVFAGWSTSEGGTAVDIAPGETVQLTTGDVLHLYAVWKPESYTYTPAPGLTVTSIPSTTTIQVTVTDTWAGQADYTAVCALYEGDKMIDCAISSAEGKSLELQYQGDTPPLCKVFALDKDWQPLRACTSYTPAK